MKYLSTRGKEKLTFEDALFCCYREDGGLLMPETTPAVSLDTLKEWKSLSYVEIVKEVVALFVSQEEVSLKVQSELLDRAFLHFDTKNVVELARLNNGLNILELWHGDTLAFKDLAMTCTIQFVSYFLQKRKRHFTAIVVTSGDTGSSAMFAARDVKNVDVIVMYPHNRISQLQELMMTRVQADNLHLYAADGSSDDIDVATTKVLTDTEFVEEHGVGTLNSMNWCRIMVQIAHHVYAYLQTANDIGESVDVIIPCGGCGNIASCLLARDMGLPISPIGVSNKNDSFDRIVRYNERIIPATSVSMAPAMDIAFQQNVERIFWLISNRSPSIVMKVMDDLTTTGKSQLPKEVYEKLASTIKTSVASDDVIIEAIKRCWYENNYQICPHTATAVAQYYGITQGCEASTQTVRTPSICLATASAAKFCEAVVKANVPPCHSPKIEVLRDLKESYVYLGKKDDWEKTVREKLMEISSACRD